MEIARETVPLSSPRQSEPLEILPSAHTAALDEDLRTLLLSDIQSLPTTPPSAVESNFTRYFAADFLKPGHDQYIYRHANGLCVIGLAPTHVALKEEGGITAVDFNVGKVDRSEIKVTGKRKRNAQHFETKTALCKVCANGVLYVVRCCVKGSLLEVNDRLIDQPALLNSSAIAYYQQALMDSLNLIEHEMERFKVCENEAKTITLSKEGSRPKASSYGVVYLGSKWRRHWQ